MKSLHISKIGSPTRSRFADDATRWHESWLGAPWCVGGRLRSGIDCLGVVLRWYEASGIYLPDPKTDDPELIRTSAFSAMFERVERPEFGDVAQWEITTQTHHMAVVLFGRLLHATKGHGVVCQRGVPDTATFWRLRQ